MGEKLWEWREGESVPRYVESQISRDTVVNELNRCYELEAELADTVTECLAAKSNEDIMRKQLAELREEMTTRRKHAVKQIEVNDRILLKLGSLREGIAAIYEEATDLPVGITTYERLAMSPNVLIKHCKALLQEKGE